MERSISLLLGAGFSAPMGYPIGSKLNNLLLNCTGEDFSFHTSGVLVTSSDGKKPDWGYKTSYDRAFDFCILLIRHFNETKGHFDYEEFYDFMKDKALEDAEVQALSQPFIREFGTLSNLVFQLDNIYNQLIEHYLKDGEGKTNYEDAGHICRPIFPGYTGILNCLSTLAKDFIINVHTLNHDLFFERLNYSDWINGKLCDGFEELGSPYYGKIMVNGRTYHARLERYTGKYEGRFRLYKLHGSRNYGVFYPSQTQGSLALPENYLKIKWGINIGEMLKEKTDLEGNLEYEPCISNYHADFLTGTTSKIERYKEPLIYKKLFELFRENLREAQMLLIIGYGGRDVEVNKMILENFDYKNKKSFIIDPYAGESVEILARQINANIIKTQLDEIELSAIGM